VILNLILALLLKAIIGIQMVFPWLPLGNEKSTVRRVPWVTFSFIALNVIIFFATLPATAQQDRDLNSTYTKLGEFVSTNRELLADPALRERVRESGFISQEEADLIEQEIALSPEREAEYKLWLKSGEASKLRAELETKLGEFRAACDAHLWFRYGIAPNGNWKPYQLISSQFVHEGFFHLFFNMIFFFAVGFSLEDLWGRSTFLAFYLVAGVAAALPMVISAHNGPAFGASGAISGAMGAFLIRLHRTKVRIGWASPVLALPIFIAGRKPWGVIGIPAYVFLPFYFACQLIPWWLYSRVGATNGVAYSAHFAGLGFGIIFALLMKATKAEEKFIDPKIEAKISFSAPREVSQALSLLDRGEVVIAERKLRSFLVQNPDNIDGILALIQVYQNTLNYDQLNEWYGRLIHQYLAGGDKEAALYAYDTLLSSFPDNHVNPRIPLRDWLAVCEYLRESQMNREAGVEYERLINAYPEDSLSLKASMLGGEAALMANDSERALRLFEFAHRMNPQAALRTRIEDGLEKSRQRLKNQPVWVSRTRDLPGAKDSDEQNAQL